MHVATWMSFCNILNSTGFIIHKGISPLPKMPSFNNLALYLTCVAKQKQPGAVKKRQGQAK